jgi:hypothetical protein
MWLLGVKVMIIETIPTSSMGRARPFSPSLALTTVGALDRRVQVHIILPLIILLLVLEVDLHQVSGLLSCSLDSFISYIKYFNISDHNLLHTLPHLHSVDNLSISNLHQGWASLQDSNGSTPVVGTFGRILDGLD